MNMSYFHWTAGALVHDRLNIPAWCWIFADYHRFLGHLSEIIPRNESCDRLSVRMFVHPYIRASTCHKNVFSKSTRPIKNLVRGIRAMCYCQVVLLVLIRSSKWAERTNNPKIRHFLLKISFTEITGPRCFTFPIIFVSYGFKVDTECILTDDCSMNWNWNFMWFMHNNYET